MATNGPYFMPALNENYEMKNQAGAGEFSWAPAMWARRLMASMA